MYSLPYRRLEEEENYRKKKSKLEKLGRYQELLDMFDQEIKEDPRNPFSYFSKAQILTKLGNHEKSLELYIKATELGFDSAYSEELEALKILNRRQEAIENRTKETENYEAEIYNHIYV